MECWRVGVRGHPLLYSTTKPITPLLQYSNILVPAVPGWVFGCFDPWVFSIMCTQNLIEVVHETWVVAPEVAVDQFPVKILLVHIRIQIERKGFPFVVEVIDIQHVLPFPTQSWHTFCDIGLGCSA